MAWAGQPAIRFSRYKSARVTAPVFPIHHGYGTCNPFRSCPIAPRRLPNSLLMAFLPRVGRKASGSRKISMSSEKMIWSGARCSQALEHSRVLFQLLSDRADHGAHSGGSASMILRKRSKRPVSARSMRVRWTVSAPESSLVFPARRRKSRIAASVSERFHHPQQRRVIQAERASRLEIGAEFFNSYITGHFADRVH
jgi:hypothetical protein